MSQEIIKVLDHLCSKFGLVIDWTSENVVPYVTQLLEKIVKYEISISIAWMASITFVTLILIVIAIRLSKVAKEDDWNFYDEAAPCFALAAIIVSIIMSVITIAVVATQIFDIITCATFPEKIIFDYLVALK